MSKPLTMTAERLEAIRFVLGREPEHVQKNAKVLLAEVDALRAALAAAEAKLADERKHADALVERVREVLEYDALHGGDPGWEASLQDEHKTGPNNPHTLASHLNAHAARRAAEVGNG